MTLLTARWDGMDRMGVGGIYCCGLRVNLMEAVSGIVKGDIDRREDRNSWKGLFCLVA